MKQALRAVDAAFSMFSAIPMPQMDWDKGGLRYMLWAFPLIGAVMGGLCTLWALAADALALPAVLRGAGLCLIPLAVTGGVHLDGFADTCDAMYQTVEQTRELWGSHPDPEIASHTNTTISCILTNARLDKCQCNKLAAIANDGYARGIRPVHTSADGDSIFVMASGEVEVGFDAVAALACECMARAINRSASEAKPAYGLLSAQSFR